jgi:phosphoribosylaminoimidazole-succinocarboxamide synthase
LTQDLVWQTEIPGIAPPRRGKVRDIYDLDDKLLIVACDRISAYDHVLHPGIPGKGKILNQLTNFWFERFADVVPGHLLATRVEDFPPELASAREQLEGRAVLVRKTEVVPFECVARGYLAGSAFKEYKRSGTTCGISLPPGIERAAQLPEPIYTPATKAETGHDENVPFDTLEEALGPDQAGELRSKTLELYRLGAEHLVSCGLILADTKFEFGMGDNGLVLIDEVLTPDSSRFWERSEWTPGTEPVSFDKQFVRNWLDETGWDHDSPPPALPDAVVQGTLDRYVEAFRRITGTEPAL